MTESLDTAVVASPRRIARHAVRNHIAHMVLTNQYAPGEKLVQQELAKKLGVSRGVVREAIFELKGMGLVDTHDNRGGVVNPKCRQFLLEALEIREMLEGLVARRCCDHMTRAQVQSLTAMAEEIYRLSSEGKRAEASMLDRQLHLNLMQISGNSLQLRMSESFWFVAKVVRNERRDSRITLQGHLDILTAIEAGDADRAEAAMREHIRQDRKDTEEALQLPANQIHWMIDPLEQIVKTVDAGEEAKKSGVGKKPHIKLD